jgi:hypothetical protein
MPKEVKLELQATITLKCSAPLEFYPPWNFKHQSEH